MQMVPSIRALADAADDIDPDIKKVAEFSLGVLTVLEVMWEKVVRSMAAGPAGPAGAGQPSPSLPPQEELDRLGLRKV